MRCPVCHHTEIVDQPFGGFLYLGRRMSLVQCKNCGMRFVEHGMTGKEIADMYQDPVYFAADYAGGAVRDYDENRVENERKAYAALGLIHASVPRGRLLEIGAAGGHFLQVARDRYGYHVVGVELSDYISRRARATGLDVRTGSIDILDRDEGSFDVIYLGDVLEHVPDPVPWLKSVVDFLAPGGVVALELPLTFNPTLAGLLPGIVRTIRYWHFSLANFLPSYHRKRFLAQPPYHLLQFNRSSILKLLEVVSLAPVHLKIYDGLPKERLGASFAALLKRLTHTITWYLPIDRFGDRAIVIAGHSRV